MLVVYGVSIQKLIEICQKGRWTNDERYRQQALNTTKNSFFLIYYNSYLLLILLYIVQPQEKSHPKMEYSFTQILIQHILVAIVGLQTAVLYPQTTRRPLNIYVGFVNSRGPRARTRITTPCSVIGAMFFLIPSRSCLAILRLVHKDAGHPASRWNNLHVFLLQP